MEEKRAESAIDEAKAQTLVFIYNSIFKDYVYKTKEKSEIEKFFAEIREIVPDEAAFFEPWFRAFVCVANNDGKGSSEHFSAALANLTEPIYRAVVAVKNADYLPAFFQQGLAFFLYINDTESAKKFWTAGAERGLFAKPDSDAFFERLFRTFKAKEQFWVQFAPKMFFDEKKAGERATSDYRATAKTGDALCDAVNDADFAAFDELSRDIDFDSKKIAGVSILYYTIQRKEILVSGEEKFTENVVQLQADAMISRLNLSALPEELRNRQYLEIFHQIRVTYEKSGHSKIMFNAQFTRDDEREGKIAGIEKILEKIIARTKNVDAFTKSAGGKTATNALLLAAEIGDASTMEKLIEKGADVDKSLGAADFGMNYKDGSSINTQIPNSLVYRLISFSQFDALKFYLTTFRDKAKKSMTAKTPKCNITPLAYFVLNTLYAAKSEDEYKKTKALVDEFLPIFISAGAVLEENTAFGPVKKLLGL